jgi:hypothetical protein
MGKKLNRAKNISLKSLSKICFVFLNKLSLNLAASQKNCICLLYSKTSFNVLWGISGWDRVTRLYSFEYIFFFVTKSIKITLNIFKNSIFRISSMRAFVWYINCHIWMKKKFWSILTIRGDPYLK